MLWTNTQTQSMVPFKPIPDDARPVYIWARVKRALGGLLDPVMETASEIIVFGSVASGLDGPGSDLDIFVVGARLPAHVHRVDVVSMNAGSVYTPRWLGSELAGHIARYGHPLKGAALWCSGARVSDEAVRRKADRIVARANVLCALKAVSPVVRRRQRIRLRQECQRLALMINQEPVVPTRRLDEMCNAPGKGVIEAVLDLTRHAVPKATEAVLYELCMRHSTDAHESALAASSG